MALTTVNPAGYSGVDAPAQVAGQYRICLECALPLQTAERTQKRECRCLEDEEAEDGWLELTAGDVILLIGLIAACVMAGFWLWA